MYLVTSMAHYLACYILLPIYFTFWLIYGSRNLFCGLLSNHSYCTSYTSIDCLVTCHARIINYNDESKRVSDILHSIDSILNSSDSFVQINTITVIDDSSSDILKSIVSSRYPAVKIISSFKLLQQLQLLLPGNKGFGESCKLITFMLTQRSSRSFIKLSGRYFVDSTLFNRIKTSIGCEKFLLKYSSKNSISTRLYYVPSNHFYLFVFSHIFALFFSVFNLSLESILFRFIPPWNIHYVDKLGVFGHIQLHDGVWIAE